MTEDNKKEKRKQIRLIVIGILALLLLTIGATYAYFQISTTDDNTKATVTGKTPANGLVTLKPGISNLHLYIRMEKTHM